MAGPEGPADGSKDWVVGVGRNLRGLFSRGGVVAFGNNRRGDEHGGKIRLQGLQYEP
jgi:hypothetical protein